MGKTASPFNLKTIITAGLFSAVLVVMDQYSLNLVQGSRLAFYHMPVAGVFIFFFITLFLNPLLGKATRDRASFSPPELLVMYAMIMVAASVSSVGLGSQLLPVLAAPAYYAGPENRWAELFPPHLKPWLVPGDPEAARLFFEGFHGPGAIPWRPWLLPIFTWLSFLLVLFYVIICAVSILRREWVEKERLGFPLVQLPLAMVAPGPGRVPELFRSRLFWLGFAVPFFFSSLGALNFHFPALGLPTGLFHYRVPLFRGTGSLVFRLSFPLLGLCYLVRTDISFSVWFFSLLLVCVRGLMNITGISSPEYVGYYGSAGSDPIMAALGTGAFLAFFAFNMFLARDHLGVVFRRALGRGGPADDSGEMMSYRHAFWGFILGFLFLLAWLVTAGMAPWLAFIFLCGALVFWLVLTRIVAESGLAMVISPSIASTQIVSALGSRAVGEAGMSSLALTYVYAADHRTFPAVAITHAGRIAADLGKTSTRPLVWVMMGGLVIGLVVSTLMVMHLAYRHGGINLNAWFFDGGPQTPYTYAAYYMRFPSGPNALSWFNRLLGAGLMFALLFLKNRLLWWPLHPIGLTVGMVLWVTYVWFTIFLAWLIKSSLLRYGGPRVYEAGKPVFFGFIVGQYSAAVIWFLIDVATGVVGNVVFDI